MHRSAVCYNCKFYILLVIVIDLLITTKYYSLENEKSLPKKLLFLRSCEIIQAIGRLCLTSKVTCWNGRQSYRSK